MLLKSFSGIRLKRLFVKQDFKEVERQNLRARKAFKKKVNQKNRTSIKEGPGLKFFSARKNIKNHFFGTATIGFAALVLSLFVSATQSSFAQSSSQCASNCSTSAATGCTNHEDISQYVSYTGVGYGYVQGSTAFTFKGTFPYPSSGSLSYPGIPGGATIVAAYLDMVGSQCQTSVTVGGTAFSGVDTGDAVMSTHWVNPYAPYNADSAAWAGWAMNYCNVRYDVTSKVSTGGGSLALTFPSALEQLSANLVVVYQNPSALTNSTVSLADGLFFWGTGDGSPDVLYAGQAPIKTDLSLCAGGCATTPSGAGFTRTGGGGIWNTSDAGLSGAGNDVFVNPGNSTSSPNSSVYIN